jgi:ATP/maltotriose-dependent transcriptional regulator MalT
VSTSDRDLAAGQEALAKGAWEEAGAAFEASLALEETPEALEGLGLAAAWLSRGETFLDAHERAYRLYRRRGATRDAARMAYWLAIAAYNFRGDPAVTRGWLERARHLLAGLEQGAEGASVASFSAHLALLVDHDPGRARTLCREAVELAREVGATDLEMLALGVDGLALVTQGEVEEGMRRLDQATAAATSGELSDPMAIHNVCCYLIYACKRVRDFDRAGQWCERVKEIAERWSDRQMFATCRTHYADVLVWRGAWAEAESELELAAREFDAAGPHKVADAAVRLAELRRRQGRLGEAEELLQDADRHPLSPLVRAAIVLDRGDAERAGDLAARYLRRIPAEERTERVPGLELLVRARLALGDRDAATGAVSELRSIADGVATDALRAPAALAEGLVAAAAGDHDAGRRAFEDAVDLYERSGGRFDAAKARFELARTLRSLGRFAAAHDEAQAAARTLRELGAALERETDGGPSPDGLTVREREVLKLLAQGRSNQEIAAELVLSVRTVERHISNVYAKIGASGRTARAAAASHAAGLGLS